MIRTGRPAFHIKAHWISINETPNGRSFYKLDHKGQLVKTDNKITPHHFIEFETQEEETTEEIQQQDIITDTTNKLNNIGMVELCDNWCFDLVESEIATEFDEIFEGELHDNWFQ